jgi:hypothetical protein
MHRDPMLSDFESEGREFESLRERHHVSLQIKDFLQVSASFCRAIPLLQDVASRYKENLRVTNAYSSTPTPKFLGAFGA